MAIRLQRAHAIRLSLAAAAVVGLAAVSVTEASASTPGTTTAPSSTQPAVSSAQRQALANEKLAEYFTDQLFNHYNLSVIDQYVSPDYVQHNPTLGNGPDALRQLVVGAHGAYPNFTVTTVRAVAEGDLVILENHDVFVPGTAGQANFDIYRIEGGKLVEHWDVIENEPTGTASGNDMLSRLSSPASDSASASVTGKDKSLVLTYLTELTQSHELSAIEQYVSPTLYQHDPTLANGSAALTKAYAALFEQHPDYGIQIAQVAAQGDLVAVHAHLRDTSSDLGQAVTYLFRVRDGKIVEEWDSVQDVPATSANNNTMF